MADDGRYLDDPEVNHRDALERSGRFLLVGAINDASVEALALSMLRTAAAEGEARRGRGRIKEFRLTICSPGGDVSAALFLGHAIERIYAEERIPTVTVGAGTLASSATAILQFGHRRLIDSRAEMMLHDLALPPSGYEDSYDLQRKSRRLDSLRLTFARIYAARTQEGPPFSDPGYWLTVFMQGDDHYITPDQALRLGLVDEILLSIPLPLPAPV